MQDERVVDYVIPQPLVRRVTSLSAALVFTAFTAYLPLKVGVGQCLDLLQTYPVAWCLLIFNGLAIAFFLLVRYPPRSLRSTLQIQRDAIRLVPSKFMLFPFPELVSEAPITRDAREVVVCRWPFREPSDRVCIIVRTASGTESELKGSSLAYLTADESMRLAEAIAATTGLPVRRIERKRAADRSLQESSWSSPPTETRAGRAIALGSGIVPIIGGGFAGYCSLPTSHLVAVGAWLWIGQLLVLWIVATEARNLKRSFAQTLVSLFIFSSAYVVSVILATLVFHT